MSYQFKFIFEDLSTSDNPPDDLSKEAVTKLIADKLLAELELMEEEKPKADRVSITITVSRD